MAEQYVVDTGVLVRWFIAQVGFEHAREIRAAFIAGELGLETVDSVRFEFAHVLRTKGLLTGGLDREGYLSAVRTIDDLGILVHVTDVEAVERAAVYAVDWNLRFFDALVVDRAIRRELTLLTTDKKLCHAVGDRLSTELLRGLA